MPAGGDVVSDDLGGDEGAYAVVDEDDVLGLTACLAEADEAVVYGFLIAVASGEDPFELGDVVLVGVGLEYDFPAWEADDGDGVDVAAVLEGLHGVDDDGLVVDTHELFGDVLPHAVACAAGCK